MAPAGEGASWLLAGAAAFATTALAAGPVLGLLARAGLERTAYDGRRLPCPGGLVLVLGMSAGLALAPGASPLAGALLGGALWGLLDDLAGGEGRGWRHHLAGLVRRRWTTGSMKMVGVALAGWAATGGPAGALAVAATANLVNVLDLRPGRAAKAGFALAWVLAASASGATGTGAGSAGALLPVLGGLLAWLPVDASRRAMLGDTGSNALGAVLGAAAALLLPQAGQAWWILTALAVQLLADRVSLSRWIERCPPARWLDRLGVDGATAGAVPAAAAVSQTGAGTRAGGPNTHGRGSA